VDIVTHENTKANMQKMATATGVAPAIPRAEHLRR
jgi:hypothetical protein